jgi:hypothetical protein
MGRGDGLADLVALAGVRDYPGRVKCATLAWHEYSADQRRLCRKVDYGETLLKFPIEKGGKPPSLYAMSSSFLCGRCFKVS